jgi:hypothetical protein
MPLRKLIVILLSFCFLLNISGYHIIFYLRQEEIKSEMRAAIRLQSYNAQETDFAFFCKRQTLNGSIRLGR